MLARRFVMGWSGQRRGIVVRFTELFPMNEGIAVCLRHVAPLTAV